MTSAVYEARPNSQGGRTKQGTFSGTTPLLSSSLIALAQIHSFALIYVMVFMQGALGYGLTSVMGAIVVEIFQGKHYGSIFGTIQVAALAGGAVGPRHRLRANG